jgi:hypothetical protein
MASSGRQTWIRVGRKRLFGNHPHGSNLVGFPVPLEVNKALGLYLKMFENFFGKHDPIVSVHGARIESGGCVWLGSA